MGDFNFNASLCTEDSSSVSSSETIGAHEFKECVNTIEVIDVNQTRMCFAWKQRPNEDTCILKKIDCVMENDAFYETDEKYVREVNVEA
ncbi:hypothetical protein Tco_0069328 [Tanacetum coccineum]